MSDNARAKKRLPRLGIKLKVSISGKDKTGSPFQELCPALNVSREGACLLSHHLLAPGTPLVFSVNDQIQGKAQVVWTEGIHQSPPRRIGIHFLEISNWIVR
jgi:hypothetical protein